MALKPPIEKNLFVKVTMCLAMMMKIFLIIRLDRLTANHRTDFFLLVSRILILPSFLLLLNQTKQFKKSIPNYLTFK